MMGQININIRMDEDLKKQVEFLFSEFGMNMSTAVNIFAKAVVREKRIPFEISAIEDEFYNKENIQRILKSIEQINNGNVVIKTMEELEAMENE